MPHLISPSRRLVALFVAAPLVVAACATAAVDPTDEPALAATEAAVSTAVADPPTGVETGGEPQTADAPMEAAATWLDIELTDAASGERFTLASLAGGVVAIEPMAVWCSNCKAQQDNVKQAYADIAAAGVTYISLGIDPGEDPAALARYAERRGYGWTFVQSSTEFSRALDDLFGPQVLSAPSTPLIVLDASGEVAFQDFGFHGPDQLLDILGQAAQG